MDEKEQEAINELKNKNRLLEQRILDTEDIAKKTRRRLRHHLGITYTSFWSITIWITMIIHFVAGAYAFFHQYIIQDGESAGMSWFAYNYPENAYSYYIFAIWVAIFWFIGYVWLWGIKKIDESTSND